jgi:acyl carrier protein
MIKLKKNLVLPLKIKIKIMAAKDLTVEKFIDQIVEEFPEIKRENLEPDMRFRDHVEWDSINALVLIAMVNVEYDVTINAEELISAETINDVFKVVKAKVEEKEKVAENQEKENKE